MSPISLENLPFCIQTEQSPSSSLLITIFFFWESEFATGNFGVLASNVVILTLSSFCISLVHMARTGIFLAAGVVCGLIFLTNSALETFAPFTIVAPSESGSLVVVLYLHLSHLILCSVIFLSILFFGLPSDFGASSMDSALVFSLGYWHLVEFVWILILFTVCCF